MVLAAQAAHAEDNASCLEPVCRGTALDPLLPAMRAVDTQTKDPIAVTDNWALEYHTLILFFLKEPL